MLEKLKYNKIHPNENKAPCNPRELKEIRHLSGAENLEEAEKIIEQNFSVYEKKIGGFFEALKNIRDANIRFKFGQKRYGELKNYRKKMVSGYEEEIKNLNIEEKEKNDLLFKINLFNLAHNSFEKNSRELDEFANKGRNAKNRCLNDIACAEAQQYIAMAIIQNPRKTLEEFEKLEETAANSYLAKEIYYGARNGIYGLVGAFHYFSDYTDPETKAKKNFSVLFPNPKLDANNKTDLIAVDINGLTDEQRRQCDDIEWSNIEDRKSLKKIPADLKKYIYLVQVKCHHQDTPTFELNHETGDHVIDREKTKNFFTEQGEQDGFNCKYLDISLKDAKELIAENK